MTLIKRLLRHAPFFVALFLLSILSAASRAGTPESSRTIIHLLDYLAQDYGAAVQDGSIINENEFQEMLEFSTTIEDLSHEITFKRAEDSLFVFQQIRELQQSIQDKAEQERIIGITSAVKKIIIRTTGIKVFPAVWPDLAQGKKLYQQLCSACHGVNGKGNGPAAQSLDPKPTNFHDEKMRGISPFQAFNTIRLGVSGTSMLAFDELTDEEAWDIAFYVNSLNYQGKEDDALAKELIAEDSLSLEEVASSSDSDLKNLIKGSESDKLTGVAAIRHYIPAVEASNSLNLASQYVREALELYRQGDKRAARAKALQAYLEGIEPVELQIRASHPALTLELEAYMAGLRQAIEQEEPVEDVQARAESALGGIKEAAAVLRDNEFSFWLAFFLAASVILREGIEAFLIIVTILGIIKAAKTPDAAKWVHFGWGAAVIAGLCGWFMADSIIRMGGAEREIIEGAVALFAASVLLYMGFWLHNKSEIGKWNAFVKERIHRLLHGGNRFGLTLFSFIVVFREAFESVLFLSALNLEVAAGNKSAIGFGVMVAFIVVLFLSWLFLKYTARLPIIKLLKFSSLVIAVLAIILVGKGVHAIQETGFFSITAFPLNFRFDFLGLYPTVETLLSQLGVLTLVVILYQWGRKGATKKAV